MVHHQERGHLELIMSKPPKKSGAEKEPITEAPTTVSELAEPSTQEPVIEPEQTQSSITDESTAEDKPRKDPFKLTKKETGMRVFVHAPKYSIAFRKLAKVHRDAQIVDAKATIKLPDGQTITVGRTVETVMSRDLKAMLAQGILIAGRAQPCKKD